MAKRRPRLVPKIVFQVALGATAIPAIATGCKHEDGRIDNPVAVSSYGVAVQAYPNDAQPACPPGSGVVRAGDDGGFTCVAMGVAEIAYDRSQPRLDAAVKPDVEPPPVKGVAARGYTR